MVEEFVLHSTPFLADQTPHRCTGCGSRISLRKGHKPKFFPIILVNIHRYLTVHFVRVLQAFHVDGPTLCSWTKADFIKADPRHGVDICDNFQALLGSGTCAL